MISLPSQTTTLKSHSYGWHVSSLEIQTCNSSRHQPWDHPRFKSTHNNCANTKIKSSKHKTHHSQTKEMMMTCKKKKNCCLFLFFLFISNYYVKSCLFWLFTIFDFNEIVNNLRLFFFFFRFSVFWLNSLEPSNLNFCVCFCFQCSKTSGWLSKKGAHCNFAAIKIKITFKKWFVKQYPF